MKLYTNFFSPYYFLKKNSSVFYYRLHTSFFSQLLQFIIKEKNYFFINKSLFIKIVIQKIETYLFSIRDNNIDTDLLDILLHTLKKYQKYKPDKIYSYLLIFIGNVQFFGYSSIGILCIGEGGMSENECHDITKKILEKYAINIKILLILINQSLIKGIAFFYKENVIDLSLKKLENIVKKTLKNGDQ